MNDKRLDIEKTVLLVDTHNNIISSEPSLHCGSRCKMFSFFDQLIRGKY